MYESRPIPINVFSKELSMLETIVKYLKENHGYPASAIATLLSRSQSTITTTYQHAKEKQPLPLTDHPSGLAIPLAVIRYRKLSTFEAIVTYLHHYEQLSFSAIATYLHRDNRVIWTVHKRATQKTSKEQFLKDLTLRIKKEQKQLTEEDRKHVIDLKQRLKEKYGFTDQEFKQLLTEASETTIPLTALAQGIPPLQAVTRYLHEQQQLPYQKIAELLGRPTTQIATAYHHAKKRAWTSTNTPYHLPLNSVIKQDQTIMGCVTKELKRRYKLTNDEIATLLRKRKHSIDRWARNDEKKR